MNVGLAVGTFKPGEQEIAVLSNSGFPNQSSFVKLLDLMNQLDGINCALSRNGMYCGTSLRPLAPVNERFRGAVDPRP
jgi:hypothetical protein